MTNKNLTTISKNKNVFYFCIDRFDEFLAESALEKYPEIYDELEGFTWFQDNVSIYGHTYPATANMLTGKTLDTSILREEFLDSVYESNNTLSVLAENGYDINIYTDEFYSFTDASVLPDYVSNAAKCEELVHTYTDYAIKALGAFDDADYLKELALSLTSRTV